MWTERDVELEDPLQPLGPGHAFEMRAREVETPSMDPVGDLPWGASVKCSFSAMISLIVAKSPRCGSSGGSSGVVIA